MNYRHIYHAGSFADVFKHVLLVELITALQRKDAAFCYLDTHSGLGCYDLQQEPAQKTQEFTTGILKLWDRLDSAIPVAVAKYLQIIKSYNVQMGSPSLRYYLGSPCLVRELLRPQDRMILAELHPQDVVLLKRKFHQDSQVAIHFMDGYQTLKAFLPPKEGRGLVLIDPPFEKVDEFTQIIDQIQLAIKRWPQGTYAVWYPIQNAAAVKYFYRQLKSSGIREILCCELSMSFFTTTGLRSCGMMIVRPPWQWQEQIDVTLPWLCQALSAPATGNYRVEWLVPE